MYATAQGLRIEDRDDRERWGKDSVGSKVRRRTVEAWEEYYMSSLLFIIIYRCIWTILLCTYDRFDQFRGMYKFCEIFRCGKRHLTEICQIRRIFMF